MAVEVELRLYGHLRDAAGQKTLEREFPEGTTVREVVGSVAEEFPELRRYALEDGAVRDSLVVRRNRSEVDLEDTVEPGDRFGMTSQIVGGSGPLRRSDR